MVQRTSRHHLLAVFLVGSILAEEMILKQSMPCVLPLIRQWPSASVIHCQVRFRIPALKSKLDLSGPLQVDLQYQPGIPMIRVRRC